MRTRSQDTATRLLKSRARAAGSGTRPRRAGFPVVLIALGLFGWSGGRPAEAQSIWLKPSFSVSEAWDSNVTLSSTPTSDYVTYLKPGMGVEFKDFPFTLTAAAALSMQVYAKNPSLDTFSDNVSLSGSLGYEPTPRLAVLLTDTFSRNVNPALVTPEVAITTGRFTSTSNTVSPSATYKFDQRTTGLLSYAYNNFTSNSTLATDSTTQTATAGVSHELTRTISGGFQFVYSHFTVTGQPDTDSYSPQLTLLTRITPTISVTSSAGPIWIKEFDGSYTLTYATANQYSQTFSDGQGAIGLGYSQIAGTGGVTGVISTTQTVSATASYQATQALKLAIAGAWSKTESIGQGTSSSGSALDVTGYSAGVTLTYRILSWLTFEGSYKYFQQNASSGSATTGASNLTDHLVTIGLTATDRFRLY